MQQKGKFSRLFGWLVKGLAIVAVPAMFPASVGVGQRVGWIGTVLVWIYIGRVMKHEKVSEE